MTTRTRAIMPVHYAGQPCAMDELLAICRRCTACALVEDAAHAVETRADGGRKVGSIGDATCFSFYANKNLAAGEGGMLTLRDDAVRRSACARCGCTASTATPGSATSARARAPTTWSSRATSTTSRDLHAGVALGQLHRIEEHHARRAAQAARYDEGLAGLRGHHAASAAGSGRARVHANHLYVVRIDPAHRGRRTATPTPRRCARPRSASGLHFLAVHELT